MKRGLLHRQHFLDQLLELQLLQHGGHREQPAIRGKILGVKVEWSGTRDFIGFWSNCWRALLGAGFAAMLLFVLHLLGDLLEIGSRSCELRRLSVLQQDFQGPQRVLFLRASSVPHILCIGQVLIARPQGQDAEALGEIYRRTTVRLRVEEHQLVNVLDEIGVLVDRLEGACNGRFLEERHAENL
jgi:hypothetical protein